MLSMLGLPSPTTGSQPGVAMKPLQLVRLRLPACTASTHWEFMGGQMLSPSLMSLNVLGCSAAMRYSSGATRPRDAPVKARATSLSRAMKPAHRGAATDVPCSTVCLPFTNVLK